MLRQVGLVDAVTVHIPARTEYSGGTRVRGVSARCCSHAPPLIPMTRTLSNSTVPGHRTRGFASSTPSQVMPGNTMAVNVRRGVKA